MTRGGAAPRNLVELRVLDGPNLYYTRPAVKLTMVAGRWLRVPAAEAERAAARLGLDESSHAGDAGTDRRRRYYVRVATHLARSLAEASGTSLAVRGRSGPGSDEAVVAFPWRRRAAAQSLGLEICRVLDAVLNDRRRAGAIVREAARRLDAVDPGPGPVLPAPSIPVIAVSGTNGKTTTVRLIAHLARTAGKSVAYTSTDGVYRDGRLIEAGDYSGFGGAARALAQPGIDLVVLEIARGGILLRGIGTAHNDVAVVTNVSEDHLDQYGIRTLDQLAEVKATITRITRPGGWDVLNADDPRVLAMRHRARGRPFVFSIDPDHPAIRAVLAERGRVMTVIDGDLVIVEGRQRVHRLIGLEDVPSTLAGISTNNIRNVLAGGAAGLAAGLSEDAVTAGLRSFVSDPEHNPGRANLFELEGRVVIVDYAHNEEGMRGLVEIGQGLRRRPAETWLAFGSAGDRTNAILHRLAYTAAKGADHVIIAELHRYLRGRDPKDLLQRLLLGADDGGARHTPVFPDEVQALTWMLEQSKPGDVIAVTALGQRTEVFALLQQRGAINMTPARVRELVIQARQ